ncbi:fungal-specific transcription factor domain-containing protein [Ilyonectria robusta]|uniref:fungal-specific transcription factor domain-containing protein n=1 Tax=Ilyonectria robusta TaxID=1079257 RepID=UPI001E8CA37D|nr:fungal-specific transcription factor domain-containing protein [Ilyonectria robusta]KAH8735882.1 fungal-specific transcription factor domain-containing protein [Ilyonectria robusta]
MPARGPPSPATQPAKRQRQSSFDDGSPRNGQTSPNDQHPDGASSTAASIAASKAGQSSNFRNVSACNRCRLRKNRCDQKLPSCASCAKAGVACVGYDPITKKEIPRSYVFYLETRVEQLENLLSSNNIPFPPAENLEICSRPGTDTASINSTADTGYSGQSEVGDRGMMRPQSQAVESLKPKKPGQGPGFLNIVSPSKPRSLASASGVSFARVVFAAVQYSVSGQTGATDRPGSRQPAGNGTSLRDSFFGLHTRPTIKPATFPDKEVGLRLVRLYFEHSNPQIPILHRGEFMQTFERVYATQDPARGSRELYLLNMVFAIGCGVIVGEPVKTESSGDSSSMSIDQVRNHSAPEEYHASAIVHLESCLSNSGGGLEVLQAVLLLANFALLRPVPPGLWYIIGVAVRLAVDLGLHYEDERDMDSAIPDASEADGPEAAGSRENGMHSRGRRLWIRDMRRRLWWCTYSLDRLVSTCVGRPFGISDQVITTEFPSSLDDEYITPTGFLDPPTDQVQPSYKHVAHHYFRLRLLQSEILQVLQYNQTQIVKAGIQSKGTHIHLPSPFLVQFDSFRSWRIDIDRRLYQWKTSAPTRLETGVMFSTEFLELNYWQAIIMLYRQSLSVPAMFEGEYNTSTEVNSPTAFQAELREDEDRIYLKVAEAGQKILRLYRQLHLSGLVSYTYLSTHHLFMAGISYLYAIWHSPIVRSRLTMDEVDFTILAAKSVLSDMMDKCPPAETCRDAFDRTAKATIKMASSTGGFGVPTNQSRRSRREQSAWNTTPDSSKGSTQTRHRHHSSDHASYQFDLALSDSLSSPTLSVTGDVTAQPSPPLPRTADGYMMKPRSRGGPSPSDMGVKQDGSPVDSSVVPSPPVSRRVTSQPSTTGSSYAGQQQQQFSGPGSVDYPDAQTMEFLQNLGATSNGEFGNLDQSQVDLGFGMNWEGLHHDFSDGQQMNPFDTFFFGGQQGSNGSGPNNDGGMGL